MNRETIEEEQIDDVKAFAAAFALAVTEVSYGENSLIAKNGDESLYTVLELVFPQVGLSRFCVAKQAFGKC